MRSILAGLRRLIVPWGASGATPRVVIDNDDPLMHSFNTIGMLLYWDNERAYAFTIEDSFGVGRFRIEALSDRSGEVSFPHCLQIDHDPVAGSYQMDIGISADLVTMRASEFRCGFGSQVGEELAGAYVPTIQAATSDPNLGTGATQYGLIRRLGDVDDVWITIIFGTGSTAGSGRYEIELPSEVKGSMRASGGGGQGSIIGHGYVRDNGTLNNSKPVQVHLASRSGGAFNSGIIQMFHGDGYDVSAGSPFTFSDGDAISLQCRYLRA